MEIEEIHIKTLQKRLTYLEKKREKFERLRIKHGFKKEIEALRWAIDSLSTGEDITQEMAEVGSHIGEYEEDKGR